MRGLVLLIAIVALVYMEPGSDRLWQGWILPAVAVLGLGYALWLGGFVAVALGVLAFHFTDIHSDSLFLAILLPITLGLCVIYLARWSAVESGWCDSPGDGGGCDGGGGSCDGGGA